MFRHQNLPDTKYSLEPLSLKEKKIIHSSFKSKDLFIYAAASVVISYLGKEGSKPLLSLQGAIVLSKDNKKIFHFHLIDLRETPGQIIWHHKLSLCTRLAEIDGARNFLMTDSGFSVRLVFADDVEASKLNGKFMRLLPPHEGTDDEYDSDVTVLATSTGHMRLSNRRSPRVNLKTVTISDQLSSRQSIYPLRSKLTQNKCQPSNPPPGGVNITTIAQHQASKPRISLPEPKSWAYEWKGKAYKIPIITVNMDSLSEPLISEIKFEGANGIVRRGHLLDGTAIAIKTVFTRSNKLLDPSSGREDMKKRKRFMNEAALHSMLSHTNVLPLLGIAEPLELGLSTSLILPWMENKDSLTYVRENVHTPRLPLILGIINGIDYLHSKGVIHGDIKGRNILISERGDPLLCDFGLSSFVEPEPEEGLISKTTAGGGSSHWMAPELFEETSPGLRVKCTSDIWAFGMVVVELLTGNYPFMDGFTKPILWRIFNRKLPLRPKSNECTDGLWKLIRSCWEEQPRSRPLASDALKAMKCIASPLTKQITPHFYIS